jgi:catechol 2,3-dioxygenase-like lactoylglutathione lyase family enzyme
MVTRIGHIALNVADLDKAVDFQQQVIHLAETERVGRTSYLTCNDRHHALILTEDPGKRGYAHMGLEVTNAAALEAARVALPKAGGTLLGRIYEGEPGIDRALKVRSPGGHVFQLFCGMETVDVALHDDRPTHLEHLTYKVLNHRKEERFLSALGFTNSDRLGPLVSWWHCGEDHHGIAQRAPRSEFHHYAYAWSDFGALGRVADRLLAARGRKCLYGPGRHGPGNNHFLYLFDEDGAVIENCSELAQMTRDNYRPRTWSAHPRAINLWGAAPPPKFLLTGFPIAAQ